jgi:hypothetical protein
MATEIRVRIDGVEDLDAARETAEATGIDLQEAPGEGAGVDEAIAPIAAVLIGAGVAAAAKFIASWWEKRRGGLVVDLRQGAKDQIYREKDVPWGFILVFPAAGGEVKIETKDEPKDAIERLIEAVISGAYDTVQKVAEAASKVTNKPVETKEADQQAGAG